MIQPMLLTVLKRTIIISFILLVSYGGFVFLRSQSMKKNQVLLQSVEHTRFQMIQEYHAVRNLTLIDQSNPDNEVKIGQLLTLLKKDPDLSLPEHNTKEVQELYEKYQELVNKKHEILHEHEKNSKVSEEKLKDINDEYVSLLTEFQDFSEKLR